MSLYRSGLSYRQGDPEAPGGQAALCFSQLPAYTNTSLTSLQSGMTCSTGGSTSPIDSSSCSSRASSGTTVSGGVAH